MRRKIILGICAWFPFIGVLLLSCTPWSILWGYRFLVTVVLRRLLRKDLIEPILIPDSAFGTRDYWIWDEPQSNSAFVHIIERPIQLQAVQNRLEEVIQGKIFINRGTLPNYERLTSRCPTTWLGYSFWTRASTVFDIRKHMRIVSHTVRPENLDGIVIDWFASSFERNRPLWDVLLIPGKSCL